MFSVAQRCTAQLELPAALYEDEDISGDSLPMAVAGAWQPCRAAVLAAFFECEESEVILNAADAFQCLDAMACADGINPIVICEKAIFVLHADGRLRQLVWHRRRGSRGARASLGICDDKHLVVQFVTCVEGVVECVQTWLFGMLPCGERRLEAEGDEEGSVTTEGNGVAASGRTHS